MKAQLTGKDIRGLATLEILIAFAVLILCISAVIMVAFDNQSLAVDLQTNNEAVSKAQAILEKARADSREDFNLVNSFTTTNISGPLSYTETLKVTQTDLFTKEVTSTVTWQTAGRTLKTILTTLLTNPSAVGGGDTCSSELVGDWTSLNIDIYEFGADILEGSGTTSVTSSGFPITSIQTFDYKMYVTINNTNGNNNGTLFVLDIADPSDMPKYLEEVDNNPGVQRGLNSIAVAGDGRALVASAHTPNFNTCVNTDGTNLSCGQLQIIDLSDMSVDYTYKVPGVTGTSGQGIGNVLVYRDGIVYLGLANSPGGAEFHTIDVSGSAPSLLYSVEIGNGVNSILVKDDYAYVASPNNEELKIFDISTPSAIDEVGGFSAPGGGVPFNGHGKSLNLVGNELYLGRTLIDSESELYILNNSNPEANLSEISSMEVFNAK